MFQEWFRMSKEDKINHIIAEAKQKIQKGNTREAQHLLFQALGTANRTQNEKSANIILNLLRNMGLYLINSQSIELKPLETKGFILDIGGGGEGIIGKLNGKQVVAIDTRERELEETENEALKIVMDATDLKFLPKSFSLCTAFFSLMYIPKDKHFVVFQEIYKTLTENGRFMLWDVRIPKVKEEYKEFIVPLRIQMFDEIVETGYGVKWHIQDIEYFKSLAQQTKFRIVNEWNKEEIFYLEMAK